MSIEEQALKFLLEHKNASVIVMEMESGLPVKAIYDGVDASGNIRRVPAVFVFDPIRF